MSDDMTVPDERETLIALLHHVDGVMGLCRQRESVSAQTQRDLDEAISAVRRTIGVLAALPSGDSPQAAPGTDEELLAENERLRNRLQALEVMLLPVVRTERDEARAENERLRERLAVEEDAERAAGEHIDRLQERHDALEAALDRVRALLPDWDANGNSRPLGDPTAEVWHNAATQLRAALEVSA